MDIPYLGTCIYHICNSTESKHCYDLLSYDFCIMRQNFPFFGLENSYCDADALGFVCGVQACWWVVVAICHSSDTRGLKCCLFHLGSGWLCWVSNVWFCGRGLLKGWVNWCQRGSSSWCRRACAHEQLCKGTALTQKEADRSLLQQEQHMEASITTLSFARCQISAWIQKALCGCSDLYTSINSGRMFTLKSPFFSHVSLQTETQNN